jgi:hypothetical protein
MLFGLAPAFSSFRASVAPSLKEEGGPVSSGRAPLTLRKGLIVAQVGISVILLVGAGLFVRTLWNLKFMDTGMDRVNVLHFKLNNWRDYTNPRRAQRYLHNQGANRGDTRGAVHGGRQPHQIPAEKFRGYSSGGPTG